jgi:hypothetical protein
MKSINDIMEVKKIADTLLEYYGYSNRVNVILRKSSCSFIKPLKNEITVSLVDASTNEQIAIHEIAHLITFLRHGFIYKNKKRISHGKEFMATLLELINLWYKDTDRYNWYLEYPCLQGWYKQYKLRKEKI